MVVASSCITTCAGPPPFLCILSNCHPLRTTQGLRIVIFFCVEAVDELGRECAQALLTAALRNARKTEEREGCSYIRLEHQTSA